MTEDTSLKPAETTFTQAEIEDGKTMAILAYIIFLVPLLAARDKRFAMYHTQQAIALWAAFIVIYIVIVILTIIVNQISSTMGCVVSVLTFIPWIAYVVLWIMGLLNAIGGKAKELPVIGAWGNKLNLVK